MLQTKPPLKILFADDHIPDPDIPDDEINKPNFSADFIKVLSKMRQIVNILTDAGYDVTVARTSKEFSELISHSHFDIAIVDLGWFADEAVPRSQRGAWGWKLCKEIDEADNRLQSKPTAQIMCSSRFLEDPSISREAADKGILPVYKDYDRPEITAQALRASVKFMETLQNRSPITDIIIKYVSSLQQMMINSLTQSLVEYRSDLSPQKLVLAHFECSR